MYSVKMEVPEKGPGDIRVMPGLPFHPVEFVKTLAGTGLFAGERSVIRGKGLGI